jgi:hypothetical protein
MKAKKKEAILLFSGGRIPDEEIQKAAKKTISIKLYCLGQRRLLPLNQNHFKRRNSMTIPEITTPDQRSKKFIFIPFCLICQAF